MGKVLLVGEQALEHADYLLHLSRCAAVTGRSLFTLVIIIITIMYAHTATVLHRVGQRNEHARATDRSSLAKLTSSSVTLSR